MQKFSKRENGNETHALLHKEKDYTREDDWRIE